MDWCNIKTRGCVSKYYKITMRKRGTAPRRKFRHGELANVKMMTRQERTKNGKQFILWEETAKKIVNKYVTPAIRRLFNDYDEIFLIFKTRVHRKSILKVTGLTFSEILRDYY